MGKKHVIETSQEEAIKEQEKTATCCIINHATFFNCSEFSGFTGFLPKYLDICAPYTES